jgi:hypothetical protein
MKVRYHAFKEYQVANKGGSDEEIAAQAGAEAARIRQLRYSLVCSVHHARRRKLYLGATNGGGDILVEFDLRTNKFRSCGFGKSGLFRPHDVKIHKGLHLDEANDRLFFGTASLSPLPAVIGKPGGLLAYYDIKTGSYHEIGRPLDGEFFQSTCWDLERGLVHLFTDRCVFATYDLRKNKLLFREAMESIPHNSCLDDDGGVWGTYSPGSHEFFRYNGAKRRFEFPKCVLPNAVAGANIQYPGAGPVDGMLNGGDGYLYIGTTLGELYRLDPRRDEVKYLGKPFSTRRLPGLAIGPDGLLYVCGGYRPYSMLARYDRQKETFEYLGQIRHEDGKWMEYAHEIIVVDRTVYAMETDNTTRSGYLWACEV